MGVTSGQLIQLGFAVVFGVGFMIVAVSVSEKKLNEIQIRL
jgi:hypothetical protein